MTELTSSFWKLRHTGLLPVLILVLLLVSVSFAGCGSEEEEPPEPEPIEETPEPEEEPDEDDDESENASPRPEEGEAVNPLTGLFQREELLARRILGVVIDNSPRARPHLGLTEAEVVFEMLVEGGATRYVALFLSEHPEMLGPVRSARHYFVQLMESLDAALIHCGGSPQAYTMIRQRNFANLDDLRGGGSFVRRPSPGVPYEHTLFTRMPENREQLAERGLEREDIPAAPWGFAGGRDAPGISGQEGQEMEEFRIDFPRGYESYATSYVYDEEEDVYWRSLAGEPHEDRETGEELSFSNVIVLWAETEPIPGDREGRLNIDLDGSGEALIITAGRGFSGLWSAEEEFGVSGPQGREVRLTPGKTWITILPLDTAIEVEGLQP